MIFFNDFQVCLHNFWVFVMIFIPEDANSLRTFLLIQAGRTRRRSKK